MSANFENKKVIVEEIKKYAQEAKAIVLVDYKGLTVEQVSELRKAYREAGAVYKVYKNRLMKIAFDALGINFKAEDLEGTTAVAFHSSDAVVPAKIAVGGEEKYKVLKVKAGYCEGKYQTRDEVIALSKVPSKDVLVAQLLGLLTNPMRSFAVAVSEVAKTRA